ASIQCFGHHTKHAVPAYRQCCALLHHSNHRRQVRGHSHQTQRTRRQITRPGSAKV
ncbi:hypothetical protein FRC08_009421, partial [Ceratobasidium sp. 394]